jgi:hypothetical protein
MTISRLSRPHTGESSLRIWCWTLCTVHRTRCRSGTTGNVAIGMTHPGVEKKINLDTQAYYYRHDNVADLVDTFVPELERGSGFEHFTRVGAALTFMQSEIDAATDELGFAIFPSDLYRRHPATRRLHKLGKVLFLAAIMLHFYIFVIWLFYESSPRTRAAADIRQAKRSR